MKKKSLIDVPITYDIENGSKESEKYIAIQQCHRYIAYEIRNVKGTKQLVCTDIYWVVCLLKSIRQYEKIDSFFSVGQKRKLNNPYERLKADLYAANVSHLTDPIRWRMVFFSLHFS